MRPAPPRSPRRHGRRRRPAPPPMPTRPSSPRRTTLERGPGSEGAWLDRLSSRPMADARTELLRRVPLFSGLKRDQLSFVATRVDEVDIPAGRVLVTQGEPNHALHIIIDGEAEVSVDQKQRRSLGAGDFFGEISMLDRRPATATVRA